MLSITKPLHSYEQSMLLVALLFDSKNINNILSFLPVEERERMDKAKAKLLAMPRNERMTQIVFELRRLLLIDEHRVDWIHQSWLDHALKQEPSYLRPLIEKALKQGSLPTMNDKGPLPLPLVFGAFVEQLSKTPQKIAMFDPVLMKLQSLKDDNSDEYFALIGYLTLQMLATHLNRERFMRFIDQRGYKEIQNNREINIKSPYANSALRSYVLRQMHGFDCQSKPSLNIFMGLLSTALYLLPYKSSWKRSIALSLKRELGEVLLNLIEKSRLENHHKDAHQDLGALMMWET